MLWLLGTIAVGFAEPCDRVGIADVLAVPPPAILVLGERHGTQPDLRRAAQIVSRLARRSPVTLALEVIPEGKQPVLDAWARGEIDPLELRDALDWQASVGFPWPPYEPLVTAALQEVRVVAVGVETERPPPEASFPVPGGYMSVLREAMGEQAVPLALQSSFVRTLAWEDYRIAHQAVEAWDGRGYLVLLTARGRVEGGRGVSWQAELLRPEPVESFVLAWATNPPCFPGDRVWHQSPLERVFPATGGRN